jgi:hypothetical protein
LQIQASFLKSPLTIGIDEYFSFITCQNENRTGLFIEADDRDRSIHQR